MKGVKFLTGGRKLVSCVLIFTILLTIFSPVSTYAVTELETPNYKVAFFAFDVTTCRTKMENELVMDTK